MLMKLWWRLAEDVWLLRATSTRAYRDGENFVDMVNRAFLVRWVGPFYCIRRVA